MRVLILGGDGYLGWPTAMAYAVNGHEVTVIDNYLRRNIARETSSEALMPNPNLRDRAEIFEAQTGKHIDVIIGDCCNYRILERLFKEMQPEVAIHYAEQPSAPYSMMGYEEAKQTLDNNINATFSLIWAVIEHAPDCHIIKLGTMGEYGTPNIDIEEGWIEIAHNGRTDKFLYPRQAGSLYHTTKVLDTDLLWFYVRTYGIRVTDLMQGPVYGLSTEEADLDDSLLPNFHYDDIFGTVVNRFLVQAVAGVPLTVYGQGGQTRGYLNLKDTLQCVDLAMMNPVERGELRILNQFTEQFSVNTLAEKVKEAGRNFGLDVEIKSIDNPRKEKEDHYYNAKHHGLIELGLEPHYMTEEVLSEMLEKIIEYRDHIDKRKILPRVRWC
ncbi:MAG TPA: NAD-dependent epimerase/dehydratase family protein [Gammaproteobacteria bacterium]|nr:NAD-dependent epimerase/dehydratase family protein [Gammaproteobacteria bacterium]